MINDKYGDIGGHFYVIQQNKNADNYWNWSMAEGRENVSCFASLPIIIITLWRRFSTILSKKGLNNLGQKKIISSVNRWISPEIWRKWLSTAHEFD